MARIKKETPKEATDRILEYMASPLPFIEDMWGLVPQPIRAEAKARVQVYMEDGRYDEIRPEFFEKYEEGKHITYQQWLILKTVENALTGKARRRISVRSGHGIGKSCTMSWLLLWFLFVNHNAQIGATAPSKSQMYDVLWKETKKWINRMPVSIGKQYEHQTQYIRMIESQETWFARAATAKKESPEALAGLHGDAVMLLIDEASGVPEEIFNTAEGALTEENIFVIMISNPTRTTGYFFQSHNHGEGGDAAAWEKFHFSTIDCPRVTTTYEDRIITKHGKDSDEYKIRVLGEFPDADAEDDDGYSPLFTTSDIDQIDEKRQDNGRLWIGRPIMGIDPAGEGSDSADFVIRDGFKVKRVRSLKTSTPKEICRDGMELAIKHGVDPEDIYIDSFGLGAKTAMEFAREGWDINSVFVGDQCPEEDDKELYLNIRAMIYMRAHRWCKIGGQFIRNIIWDTEPKGIRFRRTEGKSRIQIMSKKIMKKKGYKSPNTMDAFALTFTDDIGEQSLPIKTITKAQIAAREQGQTVKKISDPYAAV